MQILNVKKKKKNYRNITKINIFNIVTKAMTNGEILACRKVSLGREMLERKKERREEGRVTREEDYKLGGHQYILVYTRI